MKKNKKTLIILALILALVLGSAGGYFILDRQKYISEQKNLANYITLVRKGVDITNTKQNDYCLYGHQKYSKGDLSCVASYSFSSPARAESQISAKIKQLKWLGGRTNTASLTTNEDGTPVFSELFNHNGLSCRYTVRTNNEKNTYYVGCYGPAKAEWFPVKDN